MNELGIHLNCGSFRPKWLRANVERTVVNVSFSLEVPASDSKESVNDLREKVEEAIARWSRSQWCKTKKNEP
jgi:hypothetical protein